MHSHIHTLFVLVLLGACRRRIHDPFFLFSIYPISSFLLSFHWQYKEESRPVPSCNPSLHLDVCTIVCCFKSFPDCDHSPVFLNLTFCIFISFVLTDILPLFFFFSIPLYFEVAGKLVFRSVGIAIASPSQLESGSQSTAHKHTHRYACFFVHHAVFVWVAYTDMWLCGLVHGCLTCKDALLVGASGFFSSLFCLFIISFFFICFSPSSNKS